jgi:hypothetical protein
MFWLKSIFAMTSLVSQLALYLEAGGYNQQLIFTYLPKNHRIEGVKVANLFQP